MVVVVVSFALLSLVSLRLPRSPGRPFCRHSGVSPRQRHTQREREKKKNTWRFHEYPRLHQPPSLLPCVSSPSPPCHSGLPQQPPPSITASMEKPISPPLPLLFPHRRTVCPLIQRSPSSLSLSLRRYPCLLFLAVRLFYFSLPPLISSHTPILCFTSQASFLSIAHTPTHTLRAFFCFIGTPHTLKY